MKVFLCLTIVCGLSFAATISSPTLRLRPKPDMMASPKTALETLNLPSNATSIRAELTDTFSCENRTYGYYADVENDCQVFHVCLPVTYPGGKERTFRWSFICPEETQFNQENFSCVRPEDAIDCSESELFYDLNENFGHVPTESSASETNSTTFDVMPRKRNDIESKNENTNQTTLI